MHNKITFTDIFMASMPNMKMSLKKGFLGVVLVSSLALTGCSKKPPVVVVPPIVVVSPDDYIREPIGTVIDEKTGQTVDLAQLKAQYGDLYRLYEPLTAKEIDEGFWTLINNIRNFGKINRKRMESGLTPINYFGFVEQETLENYKLQANLMMERYIAISTKISKSTDPKLNKFIIYYRLIPNSGIQFNQPNGIDEAIDTGKSSLLTDVDKEAYLRNSNVFYENYKQCLIELGFDSTNYLNEKEAVKTK